MYPSVEKVKALDNYKLELLFDTGETKYFDLSSYLDHGIFQELKDIHLFNQVFVSFDSIEWPNGIDLDPEVLYSDSLNTSNSYT
jgi:hypothetical protein